jgi:DNA-directed RNA polymerase specialized sigma24 family protein
MVPSMTSAALTPASRAVVYRWARRNTWIDIRDLEQEAALAALRSPPDGRQSVAVNVALSRFVAGAASPASLPRHSGWWQALQGISRCQLDTDHPCADMPADERMGLIREIARVRSVIARQSEAARRVLLGEERPGAVAASLGCCRKTVERHAARAMRDLRSEFAVE